MTGTPVKQVVVQDQSDALYLRVLDETTQEPITLSGTHTVTIYQPGGTELIAATSTGITTSSNQVIYTRSWLESSGFTRDLHYRARWSVNDGAILRDTYFGVVRRRFLPTLTQTDFTTRHPYLAAQLPSGVTTFAPYMQRAWEKIMNKIWQQTNLYPGENFYPEQFEEAHEHWTLSNFFFSLIFDGSVGSEDRFKFETCEGMGQEAFDRAMSRMLIDKDDDGIVDETSDLSFYGGITIIR